MESLAYFDPKLLAELSGVRFRAARVADGWVAGGYTSHRYGSSIEFADHRSYSPGDEARHIDWKLHARTDRYFVRQYEDESNRNFFFLIDHSGSMRFKGSASAWSKWDCAATVALALAQVCVRGGDAISWGTFDSTVSNYVGLTRLESAIPQLAQTLQTVPVEGSGNLPGALRFVYDRLQRRTCIIVLSDFLDELDPFELELTRLLYRGHQVFALQTLDPDEKTLPLDQAAKFVDMESASQVSVDPVLLRSHYRALFDAHQASLVNIFQRLNGSQFHCEQCTLRTDEAISPRLITLLEKVSR